MDETIVQWLIIGAIIIFVPVSYWIATKNGRLHIVIKAMSYLGVITLGVFAGALLVAAEVIGAGPLFILVIVFFYLVHFYLLDFFISRGRTNDQH